MTPTPRTNALRESISATAPWDAAFDDLSIFAKQLERELTEALSELEFRRDLFKLQEQQLNNVRAERDRLAEVAQAVWDRWETPLWKDHPPTALVMNKLRDALAAVKGGSDDNYRD
jgi:hypothetical protein